VTINQFIKKYHYYNVKTKEECLKEIDQMEPVIDENNNIRIIYPVNFGNLGWCLILDTAYEEIKKLNII